MTSNNVILHVEDDPNDVELVSMAFRKARVDVQLISRNDGDQAIRYLAGEEECADRAANPFPNLVLLDLKLPRSSGLDVLAWVRSQEQRSLKLLPIVMLTSSSQPADVEKAYELGANSYLVKPGDLAQLVEMVRVIHTYWIAMNARLGAGASVAALPRGFSFPAAAASSGPAQS